MHTKNQWKPGGKHQQAHSSKFATKWWSKMLKHTSLHSSINCTGSRHWNRSSSGLYCIQMSTRNHTVIPSRRISTLNDTCILPHHQHRSSVVLVHSCQLLVIMLFQLPYHLFGTACHSMSHLHLHCRFCNTAWKLIFLSAVSYHSVSC